MDSNDSLPDCDDTEEIPEVNEGAHCGCAGSA